MARKPLSPQDAALVRKFAPKLREMMGDPRFPVINEMRESTERLLDEADAQKKELH